MFAASTVFAWDYGNDPNNEQGDPYYRGPTGLKYEYDLSNQYDQMRYENDAGAQMRDENSSDVRRELDRDLGRPGGGVLFRQRER
jgi:hypothetical protein